MSLVRLLESKNKKILFTTPSHGQKNGLYPPLSDMYKIDISETDCHNPQEELSRVQLWARSVYQTYSTTFLTNGSTSGIIAAVLSCTKVGDKVLIASKAHPCHFNAVKLAGARALTYDLEIDSEWGIPLETKPEVIENYLIIKERYFFIFNYIPFQYPINIERSRFRQFFINIGCRCTNHCPQLNIFLPYCRE